MADVLCHLQLGFLNLFIYFFGGFADDEQNYQMSWYSPKLAFQKHLNLGQLYLWGPSQFKTSALEISSISDSFRSLSAFSNQQSGRKETREIYICIPISISVIQVKSPLESNAIVVLLCSNSYEQEGGRVWMKERKKAFGLTETRQEGYTLCITGSRLLWAYGFTLCGKKKSHPAAKDFLLFRMSRWIAFPFGDVILVDQRCRNFGWASQEGLLGLYLSGSGVRSNYSRG